MQKASPTNSLAQLRHSSGHSYAGLHRSVPVQPLPTRVLASSSVQNRVKVKILQRPSSFCPACLPDWATHLHQIAAKCSAGAPLCTFLALGMPRVFFSLAPADSMSCPLALPHDPLTCCSLQCILLMAPILLLLLSCLVPMRWEVSFFAGQLLSFDFEGPTLRTNMAAVAPSSLFSKAKAVHAEQTVLPVWPYPSAMAPCRPLNAKTGPGKRTTCAHTYSLSAHWS